MDSKPILSPESHSGAQSCSQESLVSERQAFELRKYRDNPDVIAEYLNKAIASEDFAVLIRAIGMIIRAQNVFALSEETGLRRENLYRMFAGDRDPTLGNTMKILASLGVQLAFKPRTSIKAKPLRPKLGRPSSSPKE
jgi:probable addiction module antidote protein